MAVLFVFNVLFQRLSVPNITIPLSVPFSVLWLLAAWVRGVLVIEHRRLALWLLGAGAAALVVLPQALFAPKPYVSVNSWAFWMVIWLPAVFTMKDRSRELFDRCLVMVTNLGVALAGLSILFIVSQLAGLPYKDYLGDAVPPKFLVQDFAISYPIVYGNPIYKSNGWVMLEPSFMSFTLGLTMLAAILAGARTWKVLWMALGLITTVAGSGFAIVAVGVVVMILLGQGRLVQRYIIPAVVLTLLAAPTSFGQSIAKRFFEAGESNSSATLRTTAPYEFLWPRWIEDWSRVLFGGGAGSSRAVTDDAGVVGLITPTVGKIFYDYGILAGSVLFAIIIACYVRTPEPSIAWAVLVSMVVIQPPAQPLMVPAFLLTTLWAPAAASNRLAGAAAPPRRRRRRR